MSAVIIAGGRDVPWDEAQRLAAQACRAWARYGPITCVLSGACPTGIDRAGELWAAANRVPLRTFPANWMAHGRKAGPLRNQLMVDAVPLSGLPDDGGLIAIRGNRGTDDIVRRAKARGLRVMEVER